MEGNCAFCDKSQFEERLIGEDKNFWFIATLGQISDGGYVLLVPKKHIPCMGAMGLSDPKFLVEALAKTRSALLKEYGEATIFEHGIVGQTVKHAHIHLIPQVCHIGEAISRDFSSNEIVTIKFWSTLRRLYAIKPNPYLFWQDSGGVMKVCWNPPAPPQYLRIVVADALGRPKRANWRNMDPELDKQLYSETVRRLKPYFS